MDALLLSETYAAIWQPYFDLITVARLACVNRALRQIHQAAANHAPRTFKFETAYKSTIRRIISHLTGHTAPQPDTGHTAMAWRLVAVDRDTGAHFAISCVQTSMSFDPRWQDLDDAKFYTRGIPHHRQTRLSYRDSSEGTSGASINIRNSKPLDIHASWFSSFALPYMPSPWELTLAACEQRHANTGFVDLQLPEDLLLPLQWFL